MFVFFAVDQDGATCATVIVFLAAIAAVAGAPGAALEAWADGRGDLARWVIVPLACGLLVPLVALLAGAQIGYMRGVLDGGIDVGMGRFGSLIADAVDDPGTAIAIGGEIGRFETRWGCLVRRRRSHECA